MNSTKTARSTNAAENAAATAATPSDLRSDWVQREQIQGNVHDPAGDIGMSDAMRTAVWITGVAFGVAAPGAFAQGAPEGSRESMPSGR